MKKYLLLIPSLTFSAVSAQEPHDHNNHQQQPTHVPDTSKNERHDTQMPQHEYHESSHFLSISLPENRNGSGTAWLPDNSPMLGYM